MTSLDPFEHPHLPILTELGHDFREQLDAAFGPRGRIAEASAAAGGRGRARSRARRERATPRIVRRTLAFAGTLLLVGTAAVAERTVHGGEDHPTTGPTLLAAGGGADAQWRLSAYRRDGDVCHAFLSEGAVTSACAAPLAPGHVRASSVVGVDRRYVVGLAGARVRSVSVTVGHARISQPTRPAPDAPAAARARLPTAQRWFVVVLPERSDTRDAPARVVPRDAAGRPAGPSMLDCTLGQRSEPCRRLARERAAG
jgi:hypothetical protein